ncbi:MAG: outer membrane protein assembly factor BamD [Calditrichaeota bacterium]|nr:outer membrane protein assembly factor BamD [Calditrichota bacterium]
MNGKRLSLLFLGILIFSWMGCGEKMGEKEYFNLAYQHMEKEQWSESEKNFQKILDQYPEGEYTSKAMFMVAFVNANYLKNYEKAEKYYKEFLEKYPTHELAASARYELEHLGKDINDLPFLKGETAEEDSVVAEAPANGNGKS